MSYVVTHIAKCALCGFEKALTLVRGAMICRECRIETNPYKR